MSVLQIFRGDDFLEEVVLSRAVMGLGRHPQNDIVLDDRSLSRFHARVERRGDRFVVVDCGAQNGVHLNGERVNGESSLAPGDRITLGRYVAVFDSANGSVVAGGSGRNTPPSSPAMGNGNGLGSTKAEVLKGKNGKHVSNPLEALEGLDDGENEENATRKSKTKDLKPPPAEKPIEKAKGEPTLVLLFNGMEVSRHPIGPGGLTVGRSKASDVVISLLGLSRKHAKIARSGNSVTVEDLGSQNGTWVNNQRIAKQKKLKHGDLLNFYDYAVLFLEDGDVDVSLPGAGFSPPSEELNQDDLSQKETNQSGAPLPNAPSSGSGRRPGTRSPVPIADSSLSNQPAVKPGARDNSASELADLGEGSFLGDEFEDELGQGQKGISSVLDDDPLEGLDDLDDISGPPPGGATDIIEGMDLDDVKKDSLDELDAAFSEAGAFDGVAGTEGEVGKFDEKTSNSIEGARAWARDDDLLKALSNSPDTFLVTVEVTLAGKNYTQMPLSQTVTRVGTDARCELSLPKSAGLMPWHLTLLHLGGAVVLYRAARTARIQLAERDVDMAILQDGDMLDCGKVKLKIRVK